MSADINLENSDGSQCSIGELRALMTSHCHGGYFAPRADPLGGATPILQALHSGDIHRGVKPGTVVIGGATYITEDAVDIGYLDDRAAKLMNTRNDQPQPRYVLSKESRFSQPAPVVHAIPIPNEVIAAFMQSGRMLEELFQSNTKETTS